MGRAGHDVFPHLHPHWLDAVYDPRENRWALNDYRYYALGSCMPEVREQLMDDSVALLESFLGSNWNTPLGYRAGGWCIQPFHDFKPLFEKWRVAYDFSVMPGRSATGGVASYDFRAAPSRIPYRFSEEVCRLDSVGSFWEFPISAVEMKRLDRLQHDCVSKLFWRLGTGKMMGNGKGAPIGQSEASKELSDSITLEMSSLDYFSVGKIPAYCRCARRDGILHLCSHPKLLSKHGLWAFFKMVGILRLQAAVDSNWRSFLS
jgi:hypothetical protein